MEFWVFCVFLPQFFVYFPPANIKIFSMLIVKDKIRVIIYQNEVTNCK